MKKAFLFPALALVLAMQTMAADHSTAPDRYYLNIDEVANSLLLLPEPPDTASARYAYDCEQYEWGKSMRPTERGRQAVVDADLGDGWLDRSFSEAAGFRITPENAPEIYKLLSTMKDDAGDLATTHAKNHYMRPRPFMVFHEPSATPGDEDALRRNGSYPSGHTAIGWATALVLSEICPERKNEILKRGFEFGQSRVIVGAHFQSDVDAGRVIGADAVAALHANKGFQKQLAKAKKEMAKLRKKK